MMIDIYEVSKRTDLSYIISVNESELVVLSKVFSTFQRKTGYKIDEYGDLVINNSAIDNLLTIMNSKIQNSGKFEVDILKKYFDIFINAKKKGSSLGFYGD